MVHFLQLIFVICSEGHFDHLCGFHAHQRIHLLKGNLMRFDFVAFSLFYPEWFVRCIRLKVGILLIGPPCILEYVKGLLQA